MTFPLLQTECRSVFLPSFNFHVCRVLVCYPYIVRVHLHSSHLPETYRFKEEAGGGISDTVQLLFCLHVKQGRVWGGLPGRVPGGFYLTCLHISWEVPASYFKCSGGWNVMGGLCSVPTIHPPVTRLLYNSFSLWPVGSRFAIFTISIAFIALCLKTIHL